MKISEKYRLKALDCETLSQTAKDHDIQCAWADIAIEWHSLSNRVAQDVSLDLEFDTPDSQSTKPINVAR